jgi:hypothetical protein
MLSYCDAQDVFGTLDLDIQNKVVVFGRQEWGAGLESFYQALGRCHVWGTLNLDELDRIVGILLVNPNQVGEPMRASRPKHYIAPLLPVLTAAILQTSASLIVSICHRTPTTG